MEAVFLKILNMSISAGWLVLAVLALRLVFKKAPKALTVLLWALVGIRLLLPFSIESIFSLIPSTQTIPPEITTAYSPAVHTGIPALSDAINPVLGQTFSPTLENSANPLQILTAVGWNLWLLGMVAMLVYSAVSYMRLRWLVRINLQVQPRVFLCDRVSNPFILGIVRPKIYLPSGMDEAQQQYVLAHEQAHLTRKDHWWKPLGFLLLSIHWFNPLLWIGYILLCRDIEFACDEKVIKNMSGSEKKGYSEALVACSMQRRSIMACPLAFGEIGVKERIKSVLHYKKPAFWIILIAVVLCVVLAVGFLTDPISHKTVDAPLRQFLETQICDHYGAKNYSSVFDCYSMADFEVLDIQTKNDVSTIYIWAVCGVFPENAYIILENTLSGGPTVITVQKTQTGYALLDYWTSENAANPELAIMAKFPLHLHREILDSERLHSLVAKRLYKRAGPIGQSVIATYTYIGSEDVIPPTLSLNTANNTFTFMLSPVLSFLPKGSYTIEGDKLTAKTDDGLYTFVFYRHNAGWEFSTTDLGFVFPGIKMLPIPNGAVFAMETTAISEEPIPTLTVRYNGQQLLAWNRLYHWRHIQPDGTILSTKADGYHPTTCIADIPKFSLIPTAMSAVNPYQATLTFSEQPKSITVHRYDCEDLTSTPVVHSYTDGLLEMSAGDYLYVIDVHFDTDTDKGSVQYAFATSFPSLEDAITIP